MKNLSILGSTGSIGRQALEVVAAYPERFRVVGLAAGRNIRLLTAQARRFRPAVVAVADEGCYGELRAELAGTGITVMAGEEGLLAVATHAAAKQVLVAVVGAAGIAPTLAAIDAGKEIALANKETLVAAGHLVTARAKKAGVPLVPVDSEHSAIFQCLGGRRHPGLARIILTASGGPFLELPLERLAEVTAAEALSHPSWRMGEKVTVDSATLMNKGLEVIEAHWFFGLDYDRIGVVIHPGSIVHSMVEMVDGSILAQLGPADMRLPIAYALAHPERLAGPWPRLGELAGLSLRFLPVEAQRFPALALAYEMGRRGGTWPAVMNAANEVAVAAFLAGRIRFTDIIRIVAAVCGHYGGGEDPSPDLPAVLAADAWARRKAEEFIAEVKMT
ncbi:MAG: 1-deoxy-D-xylulose-5-phosphate reductoisomerase [Firmicutes bacterium]|nr:1-deoxy-D-xylulose-5-phosphate reductoisomerase [Bacillota bacterium]